MIAPADLTSIRPPAVVGAATSAPATSSPAPQALGNLTQNAVGQIFQAQVLSQFEDGSFLVSVDNNGLRMALPAGTTVGDTMEMTLLATEPRPAFLLEQQGNTTSTSLSSAAKLIDMVLQTAQQTGAPANLVGKAPIVASPSAEPPELANALQDTIEFSGIFYESHVNQWINGERPLSDLLREPQVQAQEDAPLQPALVAPSSQAFGAGVQIKAVEESILTRMEAETSPADTPAAVQPPQGTTDKAQPSSTGTVLPRPPATDAQLAQLMAGVRNAADNRPSLAQALNTLVSGNDIPKEADTVVRSMAISQENAQTINLQLYTLEQHRIAWQGELWPGQPMEWEISEDTNRGGQNGESDENHSSWQSVVHFELPNLGRVSATIRLAGGHVHMQVSTASTASAAALNSRRTELADALEATGSPLDSLTISQDDQA